MIKPKYDIFDFVLPSHWKGYLIDGEYSPAQTLIEDFLDRNGLPRPLSCTLKSWWGLPSPGWGDEQEVRAYSFKLPVQQHKDVARFDDTPRKKKGKVSRG